MRNTILFYLIVFGTSLAGQAITVKTSSDSILLGNVITVNFRMDNADGEFEAPVFENMRVVSGPNYSSSVQIINGNMTSKQSISYILKPTELGQHFIPPAYVSGEDYTLETQPVEINVYPNPDGIIENPVIENNLIFKSFEWPEVEFGFPRRKEENKSKSDKKLRRI